MKAQIVEQVELFSEAELESLEFLPEELEAIEEQRVPDLDSISFEDIAEELEAYFEGDIEGAELEGGGGARAGRYTTNIINRNTKNERKWPIVDFNITNKHVTNLLVDASHSRNKELKRKAKEVLDGMPKGWQVVAGGHAGGLGGPGRPADPKPHITLRAAGRSYHLHYVFKEKKIFLTSITGGERR
jgi:hypothetical protein